MVIKGNARGGAAALAAHLQRTDTNELAELREVRGVVAEDLDGALREMEAVASAARSQRHFYHASINTRADELMTDEQWTKAIDRLEQELALTGQPRAVVAHVKEGRAHVHVAWSRIDLETMKAIPDSHNYRRHEIVARELELEFGHARVQGAHIEREGDRPERTPSHAEMQQAERTGIDSKEAKAQLTEIWNRTDSGKAFAAAIEEHGWTLARGDRRDFVVVDLAGEPHSLARRIDGAKAKDIRARMADIDAAAVPSVGEAKELQRARRLCRQAQADASRADRQEPTTPAPVIENDRPADPTPWTGQGMSDESGDVERALASLSKALQERDEHQQQAQRLEPAPSNGPPMTEEPAAREAAAERQAREQQAEADHQHRGKEAEAPRIEDTARENADHQVQQIERMREQRARLDQFEADQKRQAEEAKHEAERKREAEARGNQAEGEIRDAGDRYRVALGQNYNVRDPYASLAQAAMAEYGAFIRDREQLATQIAQEQDPAARQALELRREIEAADYMAITSRRIAMQSEVITGRRDTEEAQRFRERATTYEDQSKELRQQYRDIAAERAMRNEPTKNHQPAPERDSPTSTAAKTQDHELSRGEITDGKAERIARIREQAKEFTSNENARQNSLGRDPGGRSR